LGNDNVTATADDQVFARRCRGDLYFEFFNREVHFLLQLIIPQTSLSFHMKEYQARTHREIEISEKTIFGLSTF